MSASKNQLQGQKEILVERTLALLKPDVVEKCDEIEDIIVKAGFTILQKRTIKMTKEQASDFYQEHCSRSFFASLIEFMTSRPIIAFALSKEHAISEWRDLIGPTNSVEGRQSHPNSLRAIFGTDGQKNAFHGSDSYTSAERELRFFFPETMIDPMTPGNAAKEYLARYVNPTLLRGMTQLCKEKPENPVVWLSDWLLENNPNKPSVIPS